MLRHRRAWKVGPGHFQVIARDGRTRYRVLATPGGETACSCRAGRFQGACWHQCVVLRRVVREGGVVQVESPPAIAGTTGPSAITAPGIAGPIVPAVAACEWCTARVAYATERDVWLDADGKVMCTPEALGATCAWASYRAQGIEPTTLRNHDLACTCQFAFPHLGGVDAACSDCRHTSAETEFRAYKAAYCVECSRRRQAVIDRRTSGLTVAA